MDTSASVSGGFKGFSASASAAYGEVNNFVTSSQDDRHTEWGKMTTYNPLDYQIEREVTTRVQINGKTALYVEKRYVDSTDRNEKWEKWEREEASERYLKRRFYGEDDKIRGSTYKTETCVKEKCEKKCQRCIEICQMCAPVSGSTNPLLNGNFLSVPLPGSTSHLINDAFGEGFSVLSCNRKCLLAYAGNGLRGKSKFKLPKDWFKEHTCQIFYSRIGDSYLTLKKMDDVEKIINMGQSIIGK